MTRDLNERANGDDGEDFARHVAGPLRAPERLDAQFEARVMTAVRATVEEMGRGRQGWWRRPRTLQLSPATMLALAATFAGILLGTARLSSLMTRHSSPVVAASARTVDTVHVVRFLLADSGAAAVSLVGDFNGWNARALPMAASAVPGVWTVSLALPVGRHEYAFIVDGSRWMADPFGENLRDDFETPSSVITVGDVDRRS